MTATLKAEEQNQLQLVEREEMDGEDDLFEAIDKLINQGINAGDVKKLQDAGIYTCNGLMMFTKKNMTGIKGLSEAKADKICEAAEKIVNYGYINGSDALLKRKYVIHITTGSQALDELLGGSLITFRFTRTVGVETSAITEAFGEFRSGKTQLAHTLCVSTQTPHYLDFRFGNDNMWSKLCKICIPIAFAASYKHAWRERKVDTEGTFRPDRIVPIAERLEWTQELSLTISFMPVHLLTSINTTCFLVWLQKCLKSHTDFWRVFPPYSFKIDLPVMLYEAWCDEVFVRAYEIRLSIQLLLSFGWILLEGENLQSVSYPFQQKLAQMLSRLIKIYEEFNVAVYMTNQVIADPGCGVFISDPKKPAGGHVLAHAATIRLMFRKGKGEQRVCKVFDAPNLPEAEAISLTLIPLKHVFQMTAGGIADAKDQQKRSLLEVLPRIYRS
ncbi:meiotic recombination protein [Populus alba x Populus x berolinensis]|nr:meiotic recombination protein [Populus alba x Populus x berolinensis]